MIKCMIGDYYDYYINKYATITVFYVQKGNITQEAFTFLASILGPPPIVCTKFLTLQRQN